MAEAEVRAAEAPQEELEAALRRQRGAYRPARLLRMCLAWRNLRAAALLHELSGAHEAALACRLAALQHEARPQAELLQLLDALAAPVPPPPPLRMARLLQRMLAAWRAHQLPPPALEARLLLHLPRLAPALALLLEEGRAAPLLSPRLCLAVTKECIEAMRDQLGAEGAASEATTWHYVQDNLGKDLRKRASVAVPALRLSKLHAALRPDRRHAMLTDSVAFSCAHVFARAAYFDELLGEFERRMAQLPRPLPVSSKLLADDFHQQRVGHACPVCIYNQLAQEQGASASKWIVS